MNNIDKETTTSDELTILVDSQNEQPSQNNTIKNKTTEKPFLTIDEQIDLLESRKLKIINRARIKKYLELYNYQQVINGYNNPFFKNFNRTSNEYSEDANSDAIIELFNYDRTISNIVISNINNFERIVASKIAYLLGKKWMS